MRTSVPRMSWLRSLFLVAPSSLLAQASITGAVRDSSGAVLPGVTVEASSPALIEKVADRDDRRQRPVPHRRSPARRLHRHVHAAGLHHGQARGHRPSTGTFTATINADLRVGALNETITVTGESPIVDVQSVKRQMVLDNDIISAIPSSRSYNNLIQLIPNSINQAGAPTDVQVVPGMVVFGGFGGRSNEGRVNVDGISVGSAFNGAGVSSYIADVGNAREIAMTTSGGLGEAEGGGPSLNVLPKEGGNAVRGTFFVTGATERHDRQQLHAGAEGSRLDHARRDAQGMGLQPRHRRPDRAGSPLVLRRTCARKAASARSRACSPTRTPAIPTKWTYEADTTRPAVLAASYRITALRLTAQATPRNKFKVFWDQQRPCEGGAAAGYSGSACRTSSERRGLRRIDRRTDAVGVGHLRARDGGYRDLRQPRVAGEVDVAGEQPAAARGRVRHVSQPLRRRAAPRSRDRESDPRRPSSAPSACANNGNIPGLNYRSLNWFSNINWNNQWARRASLVTGSHSIKFGYQGALLIDQRKNFGNDQFINYRTNNGIPDQITLNINRFGIEQSVRSDAFYAQEQWTLGRMTRAGRHPLRPRVELLPRADGRPAALLPDGVDLSAHHRREGLPRSVAARRRRLRRVRHRQDVGQGELRPLSRGGAERRVLHRAQPDRTPVHDDDAHLDRTTTAIWSPTAICEQRGAGHQTPRRRAGGIDFCGAERQRQLRHAGVRLDAGSGPAVRMGRALGRLAVGRVDAAGSAAARRRRSRLPAPVAGQLRASPTTARGRPTDHTKFGVTIPIGPAAARTAAAACSRASTT